MSSTRSNSAIVLAAILLALTGCQTMEPVRAEKNNVQPPIDEATARRDWDRSTAYYANGATIAGGTGYVFKTHDAISDPYRRVADPAVATMNAAILPGTIFFNPTWKKMEYRSSIVP